MRGPAEGYAMSEAHARIGAIILSTPSPPLEPEGRYVQWWYSITHHFCTELVQYRPLPPPSFEERSDEKKNLAPLRRLTSVLAKFSLTLRLKSLPYIVIKNALLFCTRRMARYRNVCFTLNNPEGLLQFEEGMQYLVYQEEIGDSGTYHLQGYCEFKTALVLGTAKELLGGMTVHLERRNGSAEKAIAYCKKQFNDDGSDKRIPGTDVYEFGQPNQQGKRVDLDAFKDAVKAGKRKRDLIDDHLMVFARYPKLYDIINSKRPERDIPPIVSLLIGPTGLGKTRYVYDKYQGDEELYQTPLSNGTMWYDTYDGHEIVLIDDFAGAASHMTLTTLLKLLDRYPQLVPTKGSHTWFYPTHVYVTTNILPKDWYKWENRGEQYLAIERRFAHTLLFERGENMKEAPGNWWKEHCPHEAEGPYGERDGLPTPEQRECDIQN